MKYKKGKVVKEPKTYFDMKQLEAQGYKKVVPKKAKNDNK